MQTSELVLGLLYLVNLFQPVNDKGLETEFKKFLKTLDKPVSQVPTYDSLMATLRRHHFIVETKGRYSVTLSGLNQISQAGLAQTRDKNRLFILKGMM